MAERPDERSGELVSDRATPGAGTTLAIDIHVHSAGSYDGTASVSTILKQAKAVGLDGVVITDHDRLVESLIAAETAPSHGLVAVPGVEVSTADGHLLAIGVDERPLPGRPMAATVETIRSLGGVAIVPHPFRRSRHGVRRSAITECDGIETINACSVSGYRNRQAARYAVAEGYPETGGSDAHTLATLGYAYTRVRLRESVSDPAAVDSAAVVEAIRAGRTVAEGRRAPRWASVRKYARNARLKTASLL